MRFGTYIEAGVEKLGVLNKEETGIISLESLYERFKGKLNWKTYPKNMQAFIEEKQETELEALAAILKEESLEDITTVLNEVKLCAPIPYPRRNVFCVGKNYLDHVHEMAKTFGDIPKHPTFFSKVASPAIGHEDYIESHPGIVQKLDYEVELAVVIGKEGKNIAKEEAMDYIFGYTILNDVSERFLQQLHGQWHKGKSLDTFCPMGPFIACKSEIPTPWELDISCKVNGELRQSSNTRNLIFDIPTIIHVLSQGLTLKPGDIIATGTPAGVGMGFEPPQFLKSGDTVECTIEKIGCLKNIIK